MAYCKYCESRCSLVPADGVYECSNCGAGLAPIDQVDLHGSFRRFDECRTTAYAVRVEASELGMMQNGRGDRPECPHIKLGNRRMTGEALIHEMRTSVGILTAEQNNSQRKPGVVRD